MAFESLQGMTRSNVSGQRVPSLWCCDRECSSSEFSSHSWHSQQWGVWRPQRPSRGSCLDQVREATDVFEQWSVLREIFTWKKSAMNIRFVNLLRKHGSNSWHQNPKAWTFEATSRTTKNCPRRQGHSSVCKFRDIGPA